MPTPTVSEQLRQRILGHGGSLRELARRAGVDVSQISRFISTKRDVRRDIEDSTFSKLCTALGLELCEIHPADPILTVKEAARKVGGMERLKDIIKMLEH